ncbi:MAG: mitochondrial import inner membrane translocase subunit tim21 [Trichoglossum hirsutum]|nr:MAG: mitochondrial import inner membrane translocase subunit tim21 [Trichoglossum hirsutum]
MSRILRGSSQFILRCSSQPAIPITQASALVLARRYATQKSSGTSRSSARKQITVASDDGRVRWGELSAREKAARTTQQTFNFVTVLVGLVMTGGVITFLYLEVFSPEGKTNQFNRAVDRIKKDHRCTELLGDSKKIIAYGEPTRNKWARSRPIASSIQKDRTGIDHLLMHFNVEGPLNRGVVNLHMTKRPDQSEFDYKYLFLEVKGYPRLFLENTDVQADESSKGSKGNKKKFLGVQWGW